MDFELTSANADDRDAARDMLPAHPGVTVIGDKGYIDVSSGYAIIGSGSAFSCNDGFFG